MPNLINKQVITILSSSAKMPDLGKSSHDEFGDMFPRHIPKDYSMGMPD
jgi:hypothetical protein